jgi:Mn2+/Fe2+ NRAMP family transporter
MVARRIAALAAIARIGRGPRDWLRDLGPGLITGAADDDPSGIVTYSQAGAAFGYTLGWSVVLTLPFMVAVQEISARLGRVTGCGLAASLKRHAPVPLLATLVTLLVIANVINLGADIGAMAAVTNLLFGGPEQVYAVGLAIFCAGAEIWLAYKRYVQLLKWLTASLLAYPQYLKRE